MAGGEEDTMREKDGCGRLAEGKEAKKLHRWVLVVLRLLTLFATVSATLVMALNKQSRTTVVGLVGTVPIRATLTAKFQQTPAFVFFVVAYAIASFHNLIALLFILLQNKFNVKGLALPLAFLDMVMLGLASAASGAAAAMAELGKNGNKHSRWNKICDKFDAYCDHGSGALIASFVAVGFFVALNGVSIINLHKSQTTVHCS